DDEEDDGILSPNKPSHDDEVIVFQSFFQVGLHQGMSANAEGGSMEKLMSMAPLMTKHRASKLHYYGSLTSLALLLGRIACALDISEAKVMDLKDRISLYNLHITKNIIVVSIENIYIYIARAKCLVSRFFSCVLFSKVYRSKPQQVAAGHLYIT
ncbi:hypothetical protein ACJX0J_017979, partial [Zea mays]